MSKIVWEKAHKLKAGVLLRVELLFELKSDFAYCSNIG